MFTQQLRNRSTSFTPSLPFDSSKSTNITNNSANEAEPSQHAGFFQPTPRNPNFLTGPPINMAKKYTPCNKPLVPIDETDVWNTITPISNPVFGGSAGPDESPIFQNEWLSIKTSPLGGYGALARSFIPKGTVVLAEKPLMKIHHNTSWVDAITDLSFSDRSIFYSLNCYTHRDKGSKLFGIINSNAFAAVDFKGISHFSVISAVASRFNHACLPVSSLFYKYDWDEDIMVFTAKHDIVPGTELTISYSTHGFELLGTYGFECGCGACPNPVTNDEREILRAGKNFAF
ncbi:Zinc finger MYND domain-containing 1 [Zalerion maritima]|uniref:Zinc finger MYND domain-containing 1 n=1 Tax=Zalerion maritima TaxID=339359 RepID=A0AAD5WRG6_9PEZI|nr:Zinc finger MYND domain-containing 1 [Zalerion maritima]